MCVLDIPWGIASFGSSRVRHNPCLFEYIPVTAWCQFVLCSTAAACKRRGWIAWTFPKKQKQNKPNPMGKKCLLEYQCCSHLFLWICVFFLFFQDFGVAQLSWILPTLPNDICLIFVVVRFAVLLSLRFRQRWLQSAVSRRCSSEKKRKKMCFCRSSTSFFRGERRFSAFIYSFNFSHL